MGTACHAKGYAEITSTVLLFYPETVSVYPVDYYCLQVLTEDFLCFLWIWWKKEIETIILLITLQPKSSGNFTQWFQIDVKQRGGQNRTTWHVLCCPPITAKNGTSHAHLRQWSPKKIWWMLVKAIERSLTLAHCSPKVVSYSNYNNFSPNPIVVEKNRLKYI